MNRTPTDRTAPGAEPLVADLCSRIGTAVDPGRYVEQPGLDDRIEQAGANVDGLRRMLGLAVPAGGVR